MAAPDVIDLTGGRRALLRALAVGFLACAVLGALHPWLSSTEAYEGERLVWRGRPAVEWAVPSLAIAVVLAWTLVRGTSASLRTVAVVLTLGLSVATVAIIASTFATAFTHVHALGGTPRTYVHHGALARSAWALSFLAGPVLLLASALLFRLERWRAPGSLAAAARLLRA